MGQTTNCSIPYPEIDDTRNIAEDMKAMAEATEEAIIEKIIISKETATNE